MGPHEAYWWGSEWLLSVKEKAMGPLEVYWRS